MPYVDDIRPLVSHKPVFKPADASEFLGVSEDCVTTHILNRPGVFPKRAPGLSRRHEWSFDEYLEVLVALCCLSPMAARNVARKLLAARRDPLGKNLREIVGKASGNALA